MWIEIDLSSFGVRQEGLRHVRSEAPIDLYVSPTLENLRSAKELVDAEYGQAVEIDLRERKITFGRDYLGHFPLLYASTRSALYVSDRLTWIIRRLRANKTGLSLSEEAVALYFTMGYVPAGMTLYKEITACEAHTLYEWRRGKIEKFSTFRPVEAEPACGLADLERAIEHEVARWAACSDEIDVWCSGGLDSSIMACAFNAGGRRAELLTLGYGSHIQDNFGEGERGYAHDVAKQCGAGIREVELTADKFEGVHERFTATHHMPVIDTCVPPKYALAQASRRFVITGEGSDPLFGGPKNNVMIFASSRGSAKLGRHYAAAHERYAFILDKLMSRGAELADYAVEYLEGLFDRYPGDLIRRMFYINTHIKAPSLIFTESFYACREHGVTARHPYAGLSVYRTAFALDDRLKYQYPKNKLALHALYADRLPRSVVNRKKSGTVLPLRFYLSKFASHKFDFSPLSESGLFVEQVVKRGATDWRGEENAGLLYSFVTLSEWLRNCSTASKPGDAASPEPESAIAAA